MAASDGASRRQQAYQDMAYERKINNALQRAGQSEEMSEEDIEKLLKTEISSGYSTSEIRSIISKAKPIYSVKNIDLSHLKPTHINSAEKQYNFRTRAFESPTCYFEVNGQPLRIKTDFSANRDVNVAENRLFSGFDTADKTALKHLYFQGDAGITLDVTVVVRTDDVYIGEHVGDLKYKDGVTTVASVLQDWNRTFQVCKIVSDSPLIENSYYRITKCHATQKYHHLILFELTFVQDTYHYNTSLQTKTSMSDVNSVLDSGNASAGYCTTTSCLLDGGNGTSVGLPAMLAQCDELKKKCGCVNYKKSNCITSYSSCVVYYQKALKQCGFYLNGRVDGLFCYLTKRATISFQEKYNLPQTGMMDNATKKLILSKIK